MSKHSQKLIHYSPVIIDDALEVSSISNPIEVKDWKDTNELLQNKVKLTPRSKPDQQSDPLVKSLIVNYGH